MRKITYIALAFFLLSMSTNAQFKKPGERNPKKIQAKIKALKIAHLTEQLDLTEKEAQQFWPIYNSYDKKMMIFRHQERKNIKKKIEDLGGVDKLSEKEAKAISEKIIDLEKSIFQTKQAFFDKVSNVLSYKKILKLEIAEKDFHRKLLRKYRGKHKLKN